MTMEPKNERTTRPAPRGPAKRFRIEKLEDRIAPAIHSNPHTKVVGGGGGGKPSACACD